MIMLSQELKRIYTYPGTEQVIDALILKNDNFDTDFNLINHPDSGIRKDHQNNDTDFQSVPFMISLPDTSHNSITQDMQIVIPVQESYKDYSLTYNLYRASILNKPIEATFLLYINDNTVPETYFQLLISNITIDKQMITGTAVRKDLYQQYFLSDLYDLRFKGLFL